MIMQRISRTSLWNSLSELRDLSDCEICGADTIVDLARIACGPALGGHAEELRGKSVLIATKDQLTAALALIELDGLARRIVLCPTDFPREHLPFIIESAVVETIVSDQAELE